MTDSGKKAATDPVLQLDHGILDVIELALGGLADTASVDLALSHVLPPADSLTAPEMGERRLLLADPDGTPLAEATLAHGTRLTELRPLSPAEHGPFRGSRVTSALPGERAVLFDAQPSAKQLLQLRQDHPFLADVSFLLMVPSAQARGRDYPMLMEQLHAAANLLGVRTVRHLVVPEILSSHDVVERLSLSVLEDFRQHVSLAPAHSGAVLMFSGLSGSGKSTLARAVQEHIHAHSHRRAVLLDGDDVRRFVSKGLGFSREDRETNVERIGWIASRVSEAGGIALCAPIAPFARTRQTVRQLAGEVGAFSLIHISTPLEVCERRDRKGLYAKARAGLIPDFTGIDSPYEVPEDAQLTLDLAQLSVEEATDRVIALLQQS